MSGLDEFWSIIDQQIIALGEAKSADDVMSVLSVNGRKGDAGFFGGSGGDAQVNHVLASAGWTYVWVEADYYWCMTAPDGSLITYVEGDVYRGDQRPRAARASMVSLVCGHAECVVGLPCKREAPEHWSRG